MLFSFYINDITTDIDSEIRLFADDCVCYREIKGTEATLKLQEDIDRLGCWARKWGMRFQPVKCNIMQITRKRIKKINASYNLEGTVLDNVENIKCLGIIITNDLKWNTHVSNICTKANRTLGFLRRNLSACPQDVKESAYKGLVRPVLEYGSSVWDPSSILLQEELKKVQKRAARFVTGNYIYDTGSMTGILEQLKWESLKKRRRDSRIIMLYKGLKGAASIPTNDLVPPIRHVRNHHSLAFQTPFANTDIYKCSFFPQTIRDWNSLTDTLLSAAEGAEDSVATFTSLVRARDLLPFSQVLVNDCHLNVSPVTIPILINHRPLYILFRHEIHYVSCHFLVLSYYHFLVLSYYYQKFNLFNPWTFVLFFLFLFVCLCKPLILKSIILSE